MHSSWLLKSFLDALCRLSQSLPSGEALPDCVLGSRMALGKSRSEVHGTRGDGLRTRTQLPELLDPGKERTVSSGLSIWCVEDLSVVWATHTHDQKSGKKMFSAYRIPCSPENLNHALPSHCFPHGEKWEEMPEDFDDRSRLSLSPEFKVLGSSCPAYLIPRWTGRCAWHQTLHWGHTFPLEEHYLPTPWRSSGPEASSP